MRIVDDGRGFDEDDAQPRPGPAQHPRTRLGDRRRLPPRHEPGRRHGARGRAAQRRLAPTRRVGLAGVWRLTDRLGRCRQANLCRRSHEERLIRRRCVRAGFALSLGLVIVGIFGLVATAASPPGFKTAKRPYLAPLEPGVVVDPIISTGDVVGGYQMSGIRTASAPTRTAASFRCCRTTSREDVPGRSWPVSTPGSRSTCWRTRRTVCSRRRTCSTAAKGSSGSAQATLEVINGTPYYFTGEEAINAGHERQLDRHERPHRYVGRRNATVRAHPAREHRPGRADQEIHGRDDRRRLPGGQPVAATCRSSSNSLRRRGLRRPGARLAVRMEDDQPGRHAGNDHRGVDHRRRIRLR